MVYGQEIISVYIRVITPILSISNTRIATAGGKMEGLIVQLPPV